MTAGSKLEALKRAGYRVMFNGCGYVCDRPDDGPKWFRIVADTKVEAISEGYNRAKFMKVIK